MEQNEEDEGLKVLLTPEAYTKLKEDERKKQLELTDEEKAEVDKVMSDPLRTSDSKIGHFLQDLWNHPEKVKWYRDHVLFPTIEQKYFPERVDDNPKHWSVEIPIFTMEF